MKKPSAKQKFFATSLLALAIAMPMPSVVLAQAEAPAAAQTQPSSHPWGVVNTDLPADEAIRYGVLPNGMRYALRKNETPKDAASVRMHVKVGSIAEADDEQGLAHFLEHMAFNGSTNVPEGEMIKLLERQGLTFGPDTNASTSFTETIYQLDLPRADQQTVDLALMLMRETASNLTLSDEAVDRERGVIQSERQLRNSPGLRSVVAQLGKQLPGTMLSKRLPIGTVEVIDTAPASRIRAFYNRYYRPENTTLVVVGDFDVNAMEAKVKAQFADWTPTGPAAAPMDYGTIDPDADLTLGTFSDPSVQTLAVFGKSEPYEPTPNSVADNLEPLQLALASSIMASRFQKLALAADAKLLGGAAAFDDVENVASQKAVVAVGKEGDWQSAVTIAEQELRRALQYGFTQAELDEQLANIAANFENAAKQQETRKSAGLADEIISSSVDQSVVMTPAGTLSVFEALRPALTLEGVNAAFSRNWAGGPTSVFVTTPAPIDGGEPAVAAVLAESGKVAVDAPVEEVTKAFAYDDFGTPGTIVTDTMIEDLGLRTVTFANGVRLNIKTTDFEADKVQYSVRVGDGLKVLPEGSGGLDYYLKNIMPVGALGEHDIREIQKLTVGKSVNFALEAEQDALVSSGTTVPDDAELQFKLLAALISDPGYRAEADSVWQNALPTINNQNMATPISVLQSQFGRAIASNDPRFGQGTPEDLGAMNMAKVESLIAGQLASGPIEIGIVGDIEADAAIAIVAKTFGALPARAKQGADDASVRPAKVASDTDRIELYHNGQADQGIALAVWPTDDDSDQKDDVARDLLATALGLMLTDEVREKLGSSYSTDGFSEASGTYPGFGFLAGLAVADPAKMEEIYASMRTVTAQMRDEPLSEDVILRARKPLLERLDKQDRENSAWIGIAARAQSEPDRLDRWRQRKAVAQAITAADLQAAAKKYLTDGSIVEVRVLPKPAVPVTVSE